MAYTSDVSDEPLSVIQANECEYRLSTLATRRFRRVFNEIESLRGELADMTRERDAWQQADLD